MGTDFAAVAGLLGHPARSAMVDALMAGDGLSAGELARAAGVAPSTASQHLGRLVDGGLVTVVADGRQREHRLAGPEVAEALEALARICPPTPVRTLRHAGARDALAHARTCYDHLAGAVGVALADALADRGWLALHGEGWEVTQAGEAGLAAAGVDVAAVRRTRRAFARRCIDWTERRPHVAGALGAAITARALDQRWIRRRPDTRSVAITPAGRAALAERFGVTPRLLDRDGGGVRHLPRAARA
jgi:DNA-binding transcriptional ArsR family regulator